MQGFLKQSTAVNITVLMIDSADHITGKTGLAAGLTIYATKAAGTPATITPTVTELDAVNVKGLYKLALTTAHTDTLGELQLHITATGADPSDIKWQVSSYLPGEAATLQADQAVNVTKIGGTAQTARDIGASVLVGDKTGFSLSAAGVQAIWDALTSALTTAGSVGKLLVDNLNAAVGSVAGAVWDVTLASHLTAGSTGNALNAAGSAGDPWATALPGAYGAGTAGKIIGDNVNATISSRSTYAGGDTAGTTTLLTRIASALTITGGKVDVNDKTGFSLSAAGVQAIWDALTSALVTVGSIGKLLVDNINATISSRSTYAGGDTAGTTTLLSRIAAALTITAGKIDVNDKTGFALTAAERDAIAAAHLDLANGVETGLTVRENHRLSAAALYGKAAGMATATATFRDTGDLKNRITATVDTDGNRTAVTLDKT